MAAAVGVEQLNTKLNAALSKAEVQAKAEIDKLAAGHIRKAGLSKADLSAFVAILEKEFDALEGKLRHEFDDKLKKKYKK